MLQAFAFTLSMAAAMPAQNQAILATKLAEVLANNQGFRTAKVYVGALPPRFPITTALPRFTLRGSIVETPYQPSRMVEKPSATVELQPTPTSTVFYELPTTRETALADYQKQLARNGWRPFRLMSMFDNSDQREMNRFYCSARGVLEISGFRPLPQAIAISTLGGPDAGVWCSRFSAVPIPPSPPPFPRLHPPANTRVGADVVGTTTVGDSEEALVTAEQIDVAGEGLARQLAAAGWSADTPARSSMAYLQTFRRTQRGLQYQIVLSLIRTGERRYTLRLNESVLNGPPFSVP